MTGNNGTTVAGVTNPNGVANIVVKLFGGDDTVNVNDTGAAGALAGSLAIFGGAGANYVFIQCFTVGQNLSVVNGTNTSGYDTFYLADSTVRGFVTINNGNGDTETDLYRTSPGASAIGKSLTIVNGAGYDATTITDINIVGNVTVLNGLPDALNEAGYVEIYNSENTTARSIIGGSVLVVYQGAGTVDYDGIWDYDVRGNVTFNHGNGTAATYFDGYSVNLPVLIRGNLTIVDHGQSLIDVGNQYLETGLIVGKNVTVVTSNEADTFNANELRVNGGTLIQTGGGIDTITIDDSRFLGFRYGFSPFGFQLLTGAGNDVVNIETVAGTDSSTQFRGPVLVNLGGNDDTLTTGFAGDATRRVELFNLALLLGGPGIDTFNRLHLDALFSLPPNVVFETVNV